MMMTWRQFWFLHLKITVSALLTLAALALATPKFTMEVFDFNDHVSDKIQDYFAPKVTGGKRVLWGERVLKWGGDKLRKWAVRPIPKEDRLHAELVLRILSAKGGMLYTELHLLWWLWFRLAWGRKQKRRREQERFGAMQDLRSRNSRAGSQLPPETDLDRLSRLRGRQK